MRTKTRSPDNSPASTFRSAVRNALTGAADPTIAPQQQAYMKSTMPFAGVKVPETRRIAKLLMAQHRFESPSAWQLSITSLWDGATYREERYVAVEVLLARRYSPWLTFDVVPLAEHLIVTGAWWDFVDSIAPATFGRLLEDERGKTVALLRRWSRDANMWKRRSTILAQLKLKRRTDAELLFELIEPSLASKEFFLRKAIGWALREYSKTEPRAVVRYVKTNAARLSPLSQREALKHGEREALKYGEREALKRVDAR